MWTETKVGQHSLRTWHVQMNAALHMYKSEEETAATVS